MRKLIALAVLIMLLMSLSRVRPFDSPLGLTPTLPVSVKPQVWLPVVLVSREKPLPLP